MNPAETPAKARARDLEEALDESSQWQELDRMLRHRTQIVQDPAERMSVTVLDRTVKGLARSYGDAPVGTMLAIVGSSGRLEIAQVGGNAAARVGIGEGDPVVVRALEHALPLG